MVTVLPALEPITFAKVQTIQALASGQTRRKCFGEHSGIQEKKKDGSVTFSVNFKESIQPVFEAMTGLELQFSSRFKNYWCFIKQEDIEKVKEWERAQGCRVFIRDNLSISIALGMYSSDPTGNHTTEIGKLVHQAKYRGDATALAELAARCVATIKSLPYYHKASCICAVPPHPSKQKLDVPSEITALIAKKLKIENITGNFKYSGEKAHLKNLELAEKWPALEKAGLSYKGSLTGKKVILIDDLYQSGITMQFVAMKLQAVGTHHVYGLNMAKNLGDTDNK